MERAHGGVDELLTVWGLGVLERSLGGRICRSWWFLGSGRDSEGERGIQVTRRPQEGVAGRKSLLVGEDKSLDVRAHKTGGDSSGEKSRRSWVMETPWMSLHREESHCGYPRAIPPLSASHLCIQLSLAPCHRPPTPPRGQSPHTLLLMCSCKGQRAGGEPGASQLVWQRWGGQDGVPPQLWTSPKCGDRCLRSGHALG